MNNNGIDYISFSNLLSKIIDNRGRTCPTATNGIKLIATNCIKNDSLYPVYENVRYITKETYENWFRGHPEPGDLIFVTKGTPGRVCLVPKEIDFCIAQDMVAIRANAEKIYPKYLFAVLRSPDTQSEIENLHVGTLIPHFKKGDFDKLLIPIPKRDIQEYIGDQYLLFSIKIDLLHRQNKTLEAMAETLWRKMFIEDAKPDWKKGKLGDMIELCYGKGLKEENRRPGIYPVLGSNGIVGYHNEYMIEGPGIVIGRKGTLGVVTYIEKNFYPIDTTFFIKSKMNSKKLYFEYYLLKNITFEEMNSDSAVPGLNREIAESLEMTIPTEELIIKFNSHCDPFFLKLIKNNSQIRTLTGLRDTLLPKLMKGETIIMKKN